MYFNYGQKEIQYLSSQDKVLGKAINEIGHIYREVDSDLFSSIIYHVIGQQISVSAQRTVWKRITDYFGVVTADKILSTNIDQLQSFGTTFRKVEYIKAIAKSVNLDELYLPRLWELSNEEVIKELTKLPGIGSWTAEMILLFCIQRPDVFSYKDLAIHRGICKLYQIDRVDKKQFEKLRKIYSPYGSVASLYLWEIS